MSDYLPDGQDSRGGGSNTNTCDPAIINNSLVGSQAGLILGVGISDFFDDTGSSSISAAERYIEYLNIYSWIIGNNTIIAVAAILITLSIVSGLISKTYQLGSFMPIHISLGIGIGTSISFGFGYSLIAGLLLSVVGTFIAMAALPGSLIKAMGKV
jgi:hypothetical protein